MRTELLSSLTKLSDLKSQFVNPGASRNISPAVRFHVKTGPSMSSIESGSYPLSRTCNKVSSWSFLYSSSQSFSSGLTRVKYRNLVGLEIVSSLSQIIFIWLLFDLDFFKTQTILAFVPIYNPTRSTNFTHRILGLF